MCMNITTTETNTVLWSNYAQKQTVSPANSNVMWLTERVYSEFDYVGF